MTVPFLDIIINPVDGDALPPVMADLSTAAMRPAPIVVDPMAV